MDDEFVRLTNNLGLKPQGKSAPMKSSTTSFHHHNNNSSSPSISDFDYDILFNNNSSSSVNNQSKNKTKTSDKTPVYDDDIFASVSGRSDDFDDLFGSLGGNVTRQREGSVESGGDMDELIPGFGSAAPSSRYNYRVKMKILCTLSD